MFTVRLFIVCILLSMAGLSSYSQCPVNIDFEEGTFNGWTCYSGSVDDDNGQNIISLQGLSAPALGQHTMLSAIPGDGLDEYGGFPKNCPNGSNHSIKLGNNQAGGLAEGLSYEFTIPPASNKFTLNYSYAVVFEDPGHTVERQPRLEIEIRNTTDDETIDCFTFSYVAYTNLPGFLTSPIRTSESPVRYKDWTTNSVYLNGYQGKTIRIFIKTADCTYSIHFGYAYIDVSSKCESSFAGETYCVQDTLVNLKAPSGYLGYKWYNNDFTQLLGSQQVLSLQPPPPAGTNYKVELSPYPGYGCKDTLLVQLQDTLVVEANAGPDVASCNFTPVRLGVPPVSGIIYRWTPAWGLSDPNSSNPTALPDSDTSYILNIQSVGGGCFSSDTVKVKVRNIDNSLELIGEQQHCIGNGPDPVLKVLPASQLQWFKNDQPITGANQVTYSVTGSGKYYALLTNGICGEPVKTRAIDMIIDTSQAGINYPLQDAAFNFPIQLQARNFGNSIMWSPATYLDDPFISNPYFRSVNEQLYTIEIRTAAGCVTVDTQLVKTHKEIAIYVPTVFTPDGNGNNDYLRPLLLGFNKLKYFRVFSRWGKLLFETTSDLPGWDGRVKGQTQETQTIVWMLEAVDIDGKTHFRKGSTLLLH